MKITEIHINNIECELPTELPDDVTHQALLEIKKILEQYRLKYKIAYKVVLPAMAKEMIIDRKFDIDLKEDA